MKNRKKRLLCALLALVLVLGGLGVWQRNNLRALGLRLRLTQEELSDQMNAQQSKTEQATQSAGVNVRPLTEEERAKLRDNEVTRDELIDRLVHGEDGAHQTTEPAEKTDAPAETPDAPEKADTPAEPAETPDTPAQTQTDGTAALREQLAKYIAEIYVMEAEYTAWLEDANRSAIADFEALPPEQQTTASKYSIGMQYLSLALEKEKECDARMSEVERSIRSVLTQLGESTALADEIHSAYEDEKATKKAYYLSLHS